MSEFDFAPEVAAVLRHEGWHPGRSVDTSAWSGLFEADGIVLHAAAERFLQEFGGLALDVVGPGVDMARAPSQFDPRYCADEGDLFSECSREHGTDIFPIGQYDLGRYFLGIGANDEIYLVETWVATFGRVPDAIAKLVLGIRPRTL